MQLIMLGTGPFAVPTLRTLTAGPHSVVLVVTRPARGQSRPSDNPLLQAAGELDLPTWAPETVNAPAAHERLRLQNADLLVVCDYGEILKPATLAVTRLGGINLHGSLLPKYRGAAPVQWAILNGEVETGNSVIEMSPALDAGPCLAQEVTAIDPNETAVQLERRLADSGAVLVARVVDQLAAGTATGVQQQRELTSKAPRLKKEDGLIRWSDTSGRIKNQVRAMIPWPRAFSFWLRPESQPLRLNIDRVEIADPLEAGDAEPGTVLLADKRLTVRTGDGAVEILELQPAGKRCMSAAEFLRGNRVQPGDRFAASY